MNLAGKTALVTAGSRGLGAEIARQLAVAGANVALTYASNDQAAAAFVGELDADGYHALAIQEQTLATLRGRTMSCVRFAHVSMAWTCWCAMPRAGAPRTPLIDMTEDDWDDAVDTSLKSAFNYIHAAGPGFVSQEYGKIVCIGSINGLRGRLGTAGYNTAKAGLVGLVKTAAAELGPSGVNVNLVAPGFIDTPSQKNTPMLIRDLVVKETALRRLGVPEDIAPLVIFLCSDAARHVTGQTIRIDAGQYL